MPTYHDLTENLTAQTQATLDALWIRYQQGRLSRDEFIRAAATVIARASFTAATAADVALAARLADLTGREVWPLGLSVDDPTPTVETDLTGLLVDETPPAEQQNGIGVIARETMYAAGAVAFGAALIGHKVDGWRRAPNASACEMCRGKAQSSFIPSRVPMWRHKGCGCHQEPVVSIYYTPGQEVASSGEAV